MSSERQPDTLPSAARFVLDHEQAQIVAWLLDDEIDADEMARRLIADADQD